MFHHLRLTRDVAIEIRQLSDASRKKNHHDSTPINISGRFVPDLIIHITLFLLDKFCGCRTFSQYKSKMYVGMKMLLKKFQWFFCVRRLLFCIFIPELIFVDINSESDILNALFFNVYWNHSKLLCFQNRFCTSTSLKMHFNARQFQLKCKFHVQSRRLRLSSH